MVPIQSRYRRKGKTESKLTKEGGHANRYRNCYKAIYLSASHNRCKEKAAYNIAACKRRGLS